MKILVCGYSEKGYPRDETMMAALREIPFVDVLDLRVMDDPWMHCLSQKAHFLPRRFKRRIRKYIPRFTLGAIKDLIASRKIDVVLVMKWNEPIALDICRWAKRYLVPVLYDLCVSRYLLAQRTSQDTAHWYNVEKKIVSECDHLLALSPPYKSFYCDKYSIDPSKIMVLPLAVENLWLDQKASRDRSPRNHFRLAYWGSALEHNGLPLAFEAACLLREKPIKLYFYGSFKLEAMISKERKRRHIENIEYKGFLPTTQSLVEAVDEADICFGHLSSLHDATLTLPNKALQGMARGKAVLHIHSPAIQEWYRETYFGPANPLYFVHENAQHLADSILNLYNSPELRREIGEAARTLVQQQHSVNHCAVLLKEIIESIASNISYRHP